MREVPSTDVGVFATRNASPARWWHNAAVLAILIALTALHFLPAQAQPAAASEKGSLQFLVKVDQRTGDFSSGRLVPGNSGTLSEGHRDTYWVKLVGRKPTADVHVHIVISQKQKVSLNGLHDGALWFTPISPSEWEAQTSSVQYYARPDYDTDDETVILTHTTSSEDPYYDGKTGTFTVNVADTTPNCDAPSAPNLSVAVYPEWDKANLYVDPLTIPACRNGVRIVSGDYRISKHDGGWETGSMGGVRDGRLGALTQLIVPRGYTYQVQTRGVTSGNGATPWSPLSSITIRSGSLSSNADLLDLKMWAGEEEVALNFVADITGYAVNVPNAVSSVLFQVAVADPSASLTVDGTTPSTNLYGSTTVTLDVGSNSVPIVVTAADGETRKTYTVTVVRAQEPESQLRQPEPTPTPVPDPPDGVASSALSDDATLNGLTLTSGSEAVPLPEPFSADTTTYTASVTYAVLRLTVAAVPSDEGAQSVAIAPADADADAEGHQVNLAVGENTITVTVTAEDGETRKTYTVMVTRAIETDEERLLAAYDANGDGSIDASELGNAIVDYLAGTLPPSDMNILIDLYLNPGRDANAVLDEEEDLELAAAVKSKLHVLYDADTSGHIDLAEVNVAIDHYFDGIITLEQVNIVIDLYFI